MKNRGVWILLTLILILGGLSFWDLKNETQKEEKEKVEAQLITLKADQITEIQVTTPQWHLILQRSKEGWTLEEPLKDQADQKLVDELLTAATDEKSKDQVAEGEKIDLKIFGLDQPKGTILYKTSSGDSQSLQISALQNFEFNAYVRKGTENKVLTASSAWQTKLDKKINDYRNKSIYRHKIANVNKLDIENKNGLLKLEKTLDKALDKSDQWVLSAHKDWVLDPSKVKELLDSLSDAHIKEIVKEVPQEAAQKISSQDLKAYGLDKPLATLTVEAHEGAEVPLTSWSVKVSKMKEDHYVFIQGGNAIYKLDPVSLSNVISADAKNLRDTSLPFKFNLAEAHKIELSTGLKKFAFEKKGNDWALIEGQSSGDKTAKEKLIVKPENLKGLLTKIGASKALFYEPLVPPAIKMDNHLILKNDQDKEVIALSWSSKPIKKDSKTYFMAKSSLMPEAFGLDESTINGYSLNSLVEEKKPNP